MATSADKLGDRSDLERLIWVLREMFNILRREPAETALAAVSSYEDEAAELIESTGLADERGLPEHLRPVFRRIEKSDQADVPPKYTVHCICGPRGMFSSSTFDWSICNAVPTPFSEGQKYVYQFDTPHPKPDAGYITHYLACIRDWLKEAQAPRRGKMSPEASAPAQIDGPSSYKSPMIDIFEPGNEWLPFDLYMTLYRGHLAAARAQRPPTTTLYFDEGRSNFEKEVSPAIEPFMLCIDAHLKRVVCEYPEHLSNVTEIRSAIFTSGNSKTDEAADKALAKAIELIKAVHNGHPPSGRVVPKRDDSGAIISLSWHWAENDAAPESQATKQNDHTVEVTCAPMTLAAMARIVFDDQTVRGRKAKILLKPWGLEYLYGKMWTVRLDLMPSYMRAKFEAAKKK